MGPEEQQTIDQPAGLGIPKPEISGGLDEKPLVSNDGFSDKPQQYEEKRLDKKDEPQGRDMRAPLDSFDDGMRESGKEENSKPEKKLTPQQEVDRAGDTLRSFMFGDDYANKSKAPEDSSESNNQKGTQGAEDETSGGQGQEDGEQEEEQLKSDDDPVLGELKGLREDLKKTNQPQQSQESQFREPEIPQEQVQQFQILDELEQINPKKYEGIKDKYQDYLNRASEYQKQWQQDNPNQKFNPADEEHQDWVAENEPQIDVRDWADAQAEIKVKRTEQKFQQELKKREFDYELKEFERSGLAGEMNDLLKGIDPKAFAVLADKGPKGLMESDPEAYEIFNNEASMFQSHAVELKKLMDGAGFYRFDPGNPVHQKLDAAASSAEQDIKKLPRSQQVRDGKVFATFDELAQMPHSERSRYWTVGYSDIAPKLRADFSKSGQKKVQNFRKKLEHYVKSQGGSAQNLEKQGQGQNSQNPSKINTSSKSPSGSVGGQFSNIDETNGRRGDKQDSVLFQALFGG